MATSCSVSGHGTCEPDPTQDGHFASDVAPGGASCASKVCRLARTGLTVRAFGIGPGSECRNGTYRMDLLLVQVYCDDRNVWALAGVER
jgi:hypothetical protein